MLTAASDIEVASPAGLETMRAAVYMGLSTVAVKHVPVPAIGPGELLVRVEACGVCHTDLKKIEYDLLSAPRIYGHEIAGVVAAAGEGVEDYRAGDRVVVFHHIPCRQCFYCRRKVYAQCPVYKKVGVTAGYEPAGGGFSQYVRVMDWIVRDGVERIPDGVSFERACLVEPVNTCLKAVEQCDAQAEDTVLIAGQGPIGLIFTMLLARTGAKIYTTDTIASRRALSHKFGAVESWDPRSEDVAGKIREATDGRGTDLIIAAVSAPGLVEHAVTFSRPGAKILLFAQTSDKERIELSGASICAGERTIFGCYSASADLQKQSAQLVFSGALPVEDLISHRFPLEEIVKGFDMALHPDGESLKIVIQPQRCA